MKDEARALYWAFTLRIIDRQEVASWADQQIASGANDEALFELSTCSQLDDNVVMAALAKLSPECNQHRVQRLLLDFLLSYYTTKDSGSRINLSMLRDYAQIDDLGDDIRNEFIWLEDEMVLARDGILNRIEHEAQAVGDVVRKLLAEFPDKSTACDSREFR
jgi:hypothetical protein